MNLPSLATALNGLHRRRLPNLEDALSETASLRTNAQLAHILSELNRAQFDQVAALGSAALKAVNEDRVYDACPLAKTACQVINDLFPLGFTFEEALLNEEEYYDDRRMRISIDNQTNLPRSWDEWDECMQELDELDADEWSLPVFLFATNQGWPRENWVDLAEHFGWPEDMNPKWWKSDRLNVDEIEFCDRLKKKGMTEFAVAYDVVFAATENLFIDYDHGLSGEFELPLLNMAGIRSLEAQYKAHVEIMRTYELACQQAAEDPEILNEILMIWNGCLKPARPQRRTLVQLFEG